MAFDPYTAVLVGDEKKKFDPFNATLVEDEKPQETTTPAVEATTEPSLESFINAKRGAPTKEEKREIELAQPGVLGDTTYGHALYGSMKTGLAGLLGKGENGELTPGALRVLEEGRKEDVYPTMEDVIDAYNQEGFLPAVQKFGEAAPYTLVRTAPQIAAGVAGAALAPELGIGTALTRIGLAPLATVGEGMIPKAIAAYPTQIPFNYSGNILEQQQAREAQIARGETPTPLSGEKALAGAAAQSVLDSLIAGRFAGASPKLSPAELLAKAGSQETAGQALARVGKSALEAGVENVLAEPAQEVIARAQAGEELTSPEATRAYISSALGGAPMAVAGVPRGISQASAPEKARQELSTAAERADEILNPTIGVPSNPLTSEEFKNYGELMAYAKHAQTLGIEGYEKTPEEFHKELESRVGVEPEKLQEMSLQKPSEQAQEVGVEKPIVATRMVVGDADVYSHRPDQLGLHFGEEGVAQERIRAVKTSDPEVKVNRLDAELDIKNPFRVPDIGNWDLPNIKYELQQSFQNDTSIINNITSNEGVFDFLKTKGYDGIVYKNTSEIPGVKTFEEALDLSQASQRNATTPDEMFNAQQKVDEAYKNLIDYKNSNITDSYIPFDRSQIKPIPSPIEKLELPKTFSNPLDERVSQHVTINDFSGLLMSLGETHENDDVKKILSKINALGLNTKLQTGDITGSGEYDPNTNTITFNPTTGLNEHTAIHEPVHAAIAHVLNTPDHPLTRTFDKLFQQVKSKLGDQYGGTNLQEFASESVSNPEFQSLLKKTRANNGGNIFQRMVDAVARFFGFRKEQSAYDRAFKHINDILDVSHEIPRKGGEKLANINKPSNDNWSAEEINSLRQKIDKMSDIAKETVLRAPSVAGIYDIATERLLPNGKNIVQQARQMGAEQRHNVTKVADKVKTLHEWLAKDFTKRHILDEVTSEATILGARPDDPAFMHKLRDSIATNKPEGYKETLARLSKLQSDWNRLGKSGQDMYKMMRNHYQTALEDMYEAMKSNVRKLSSLTPDEKAERIRQLDEQLASVKLKGDYFPILRYGNWGVSYKENGETKYSKFETQRQAQDFIKKLESEGSEGYAIKDSDEIRNVLGVDTADFNKLYNDVRSLGEEGAPDIDELKDMLFQAYLMSRPEQSISKRFMHRKGTAGYSNDAIRAFAKHSLSMANQLPRIKYGRQILDSLQSMKHDLPKEGPDNTKSQYFYEAFKREVNNTINPDPTNPIAGFLTQFGFDSYLTSVSSALNQMASVPALALPAIGKNPSIGFDGATKALNTATQLYIKSGANKTDGWWNILRGIDKTPDLNKSVKGAKHADEFDPKDAYQQFLDNGVIDSTLYMQAFDAGNKPTGAHEDTLDRAKRVMNVVATPFGQLESASRQIASMGAYIAGMKSGMEHQEAVEYAIDLIYRDMGDFGPTGRSKLARSTLGRIGYQFQQYSTKLLHSITMSVKDIFSDNPQDRKIAARHLAGLMAVHWVLAGALGLPGVGIVGTAADELEDLMDEDEWHSYEANLKSWLNKKLPDNEFIQNIILEGPLATALGVDLKSRLGAQDILPLFRESEMNDGVVRKTADKLGQMATGIPTVGAISTSLDHYEKGDYGKALMGLFPNAQIKSVAKAYQYSTEGKVTPKGGEVVSPKEITKADVAKRAIGYEPLSISQKSTAAREQATENRFLSTRKSKIQEELVESIVKDDKPAQQKAMKLIEKFSNKNPAYAFDSDEISSAIKSRYKYLATNTRGQNIPLKQLDYYLNKVPHLKK